MSRQAPPRVLVIDDDPGVARSIERWLVRDGYEVKLCFDSVEGMGLLSASRFDVLVLDIMMPHANGWDVLAHARTLPSAPAIFVMTGKADVLGAQRALREGAADYFEKPLRLDELSLRIERATAKGGSRG